jgi:putative membrane protein
MSVRRGMAIAAATCAGAIAVGGTAMAGTSHHEHHGDTSHHQRLNSQDREFLKMTSEGARFEVQGGMTALTHAARQSVKGFGQHMIDDHSREVRDVERVAAKVHVRVPKEPSDEQQQTLKLLSQFKGKAFDCAYITNEYTDHEADINLAKLELAKGVNSHVRGLARRWLKVYKEHEQMASDILLHIDTCY